MKTYIIYGGGQKCREYSDRGMAVVVSVKETNWDKKAGVAGTDSYTGPMWSNDLAALQEWADAWAGKHVDFDLVEE